MHNAEYPDAAASVARDSRFIDAVSLDEKSSAIRTESERFIAVMTQL